jgi:2-oxo-hept-3-ene-1,7-dioate hydratase
MSLSQNQINTAAHALFEAEKTRTQIGIFTQQFPAMDMEDAYAIQKQLVKRKLDDGRSIKGWKIGLTSKAMQSALKIDIPDSGVLFDDMFFYDGDTIPGNRFIETRIEAEIAFVMKQDLAGPDTSREDVISATDYVTPSLEILDTRIQRIDKTTGATRKIFDTIADNAANAGIVLGNQRHKLSDLDLRWVGAIVYRNGEVEETGLGAGVLNDPVLAIAWLANRLAKYGQKISAGDVVLSGSFIRPIEARSGDEICADFGSFGEINCKFR